MGLGFFFFFQFSTFCVAVVVKMVPFSGAFCFIFEGDLMSSWRLTMQISFSFSLFKILDLAGAIFLFLFKEKQDNYRQFYFWHMIISPPKCCFRCYAQNSKASVFWLFFFCSLLKYRSYNCCCGC